MLRMIEQVAAMLARILAKKQAGQIAEARSEAENLSAQNIGLTLTELKSLSPEAVAQLLDKLGALRTIRAVTLAELLLVDAELHEANQIPNQSISNYVHAFCLLADEVDKLSREEQSFYRAKLDMLANRLGDLKTHPYIKARLRDFETSKTG
jgi:predicted component of type VI protein secretion system